MRLGAKAYLRKAGFQFDKTPAKLDRLFFSSLNDKGKDDFARYSMAPPQYKDIKQLLQIPQTAKQAARLFSSDANRYVASMECINQILSLLPPGKAIDMGCGAGFLIDFLSQNHSEFTFEGLESQTNLAMIANKFTGKNVYNLNYLTDSSKKEFDYVICEFGWDHSDIADGEAPHDLSEIDGHQYCVGCSKANELSFELMIQNWGKWLSPNGVLVVMGRLSTIGAVKALLMAANKNNLVIMSENSRWLYWTHDGEKQRAPALTLRKGEPKTDDAIREDAAAIFRLVAP
jgi:SAM-dependent methyltransferase